jgi:hypothetical protein
MNPQSNTANPANSASPTGNVSKQDQRSETQRTEQHADGGAGQAQGRGQGQGQGVGQGSSFNVDKLEQEARQIMGQARRFAVPLALGGAGLAVLIGGGIALSMYQSHRRQRQLYMLKRSLPALRRFMKHARKVGERMF